MIRWAFGPRASGFATLVAALTVFLLAVLWICGFVALALYYPLLLVAWVLVPLGWGWLHVYREWKALHFSIGATAEN